MTRRLFRAVRDCTTWIDNVEMLVAHAPDLIQSEGKLLIASLQSIIKHRTWVSFSSNELERLNNISVHFPKYTHELHVLLLALNTMYDQQNITNTHAVKSLFHTIQHGLTAGIHALSAHGDAVVQGAVLLICYWHGLVDTAFVLVAETAMGLDKAFVVLEGFRNKSSITET